MRIRTFKASFNGGEVTPEFWGQVGDAKFQTGLAICRNFRVLPHGPAENRPGTAYVNTCKTPAKQARLIPFTYSTTQTMVLEFGDSYIRFHTQGATLLSAGVPYEVATPYLEADLFSLHYVQSNDVLTIVHPNYAPRELRRLGATNWTLTTISFASSLSAPTGVSASATGWATNATGTNGATTITVDSTNGVYQGANVTGTGIGTNATVTGITYSNGTVTLSVANSAAVSGTVRFAGPITYSYVVTAVGPNGVDESLPSAAVTASNNLASLNTSNTITWSAVTGAASYNVYRLYQGLYCFVGQTTGTSFTDSNATASLAKTVPNNQNPLASAGNYPSAVSYFEQRRVFAGTTNQPQNIWMTKSGTESNMNYSLPVRDDDAVFFRVAARESNSIRHLVPLQSLLALTAGGEWRVTSVNTDAITPTSVSVKPQSYVGANNAQPVIVNYNVIYAAARGGHLREVSYSLQNQGYVTGDLSLRAPHLFDQYDIQDLAYAKAPYPMVWAVSTSGKLLGLTYVPEQNVTAIHWHDTYAGTFESVAVVAEGSEDYLYAIVRRTINGSQTRYVERMASRKFATQSDAFFVDCGATYNGAATTSITGLTWLEGMTVNVLGDGAVLAPKTVTAGAITLEVACSKVQVGLPITADLQTLPGVAQIDASLGQGRVKNVNRVWLRVVNSSGIFIGPDFNLLRQYKQRTTEPYGTPPALITDEIDMAIEPKWQTAGSVCLRQSDPLPVTVASLTAEVEVGE